MHVPGTLMPGVFPLCLGFVTSTSCGRAGAANSLYCAARHNWVVMSTGALQRNAKHEAMLSNI
jgi:hypothetical protein